MVPVILGGLAVAPFVVRMCGGHPYTMMFMGAMSGCCLGVISGVALGALNSDIVHTGPSSFRLENPRFSHTSYQLLVLSSMVCGMAAPVATAVVGACVTAVLTTMAFAIPGNSVTVTALFG
jgi:hypothetical protein